MNRRFRGYVASMTSNRLGNTYLPREIPRTHRLPRAVQDRLSPCRSCCRSYLLFSYNERLSENFEVTRNGSNWSETHSGLTNLFAFVALFALVIYVNLHKRLFSVVPRRYRKVSYLAAQGNVARTSSPLPNESRTVVFKMRNK